MFIYEPTNTFPKLSRLNAAIQCNLIIRKVSKNTLQGTELSRLTQSLYQVVVFIHEQQVSILK